MLQQGELQTKEGFYLELLNSIKLLKMLGPDLFQVMLRASEQDLLTKPTSTTWKDLMPSKTSNLLIS
ncbi:hypothetical protein CLV48_101141 [Cecembia rubra]|uniref:Uncharacterized protein n=1 Tax=Cecembia rubra TaxID=1485585 RepID=A0A2P8ECN2_9BACT|nr:hypothetical protein CLV48_101141 [Cecembia rubra]